MRSGVALFILTSMLTAVSWAAQMNINADTMVINQLQAALSGLNPKDFARYPIMTRLGDLYSDRGRLESMKSVGDRKSCPQCAQQSTQDDNQALQYYASSISHVNRKNQNAIIMQMAFLNQALNRPAQARRIYHQIIANRDRRYFPKTIGDAYRKLGLLSFNDNHFKRAQWDFKRAWNIPQTSRRGWLMYHMAWCDLNLGRLRSGITRLEVILSTPRLLQTSSTNGLKLDVAFQESVSHDLATFMARTAGTARQIETLIRLSPKESVQSNLEYFAKETAHLGDIPEAIMAWRALSQMKPNSLELIKVYVHLAQLELNENRHIETAQDLNAAMVTWKKSGCSDSDVCPRMKQDMRNVIIHWNRQKHPSVALLSVYQSYTNLFNDDLNMFYFGAELASQLRRPAIAIPMYRRASALAQQKHNSRLLEGALLGEISEAELSHRADWRLAAYNHYLQVEPNGPHNVEVRYQKASLALKQGHVASAAQQFHDVAVIKDEANSHLRKQAADLALSALAKKKDDVHLENWSAQFAGLFPKYAASYNEVGRRAALHQVAGILDQKHVSSDDLNQVLQILSKVSVAGASKQDKVSFYETEIRAAKLAHNLQRMSWASHRLLAIRGLTATDHEFALSQLEWIAEMKLHFANALALTEQMRLPKLSRASRYLRLAVLSELADRDPIRYYMAYLRVHPRGEQAAEIRAKLVLLSRYPLSEFRRQEKFLRWAPKVSSTLALKLLSRTHNYAFAQTVLRQIPRIRQFPDGQTLQEYVFVHNLQPLKAAIARVRIYTWSQRILAQDLQRRIALLHKIQYQGAIAIRTGSWVMQVAVLEILQHENQRLAKEVSHFPPPHRLRGYQLTRYRQLQNQQIQYYSNQASTIADKLNSFWENSGGLQTILSRYETEPQRLVSLDHQLLDAIMQGAPSDTKDQVLDAESKRKSLNRVDIAKLEFSIRQNPFDQNSLQSLLQAEQLMGHRSMAEYLSARLTTLQSGVL